MFCLGDYFLTPSAWHHQRLQEHAGTLRQSHLGGEPKLFRYWVPLGLIGVPSTREVCFALTRGEVPHFLWAEQPSSILASYWKLFVSHGGRRKKKALKTVYTFSLIYSVLTSKPYSSPIIILHTHTYSLTTHLDTCTHIHRIYIHTHTICLLSHSCLTLQDPMDYSPLDSSIHGILQARLLECHALLQGIFPTQGSNLLLLCLLHRQVGSLPLTPPGKHIYIHIYT